MSHTYSQNLIHVAIFRIQPHRYSTHQRLETRKNADCCLPALGVPQTRGLCKSRSLAREQI
jgi:hypothetical protein